VTAIVVGCAGDRYFGDWSGDQDRSAKTDSAGSTDTIRQAEAVANVTSQPDREPASLLDSSPGSFNTADKRVQRLAVHMDVLRVEVPLGAISESYKIWDHLDEHAIGGERVVMLKQNGLRVGVGRPEAWEPIKTIIEGITDRLIYHEPASLNARALALEISTGPDDQTVFWFRRDGTMKGETFPGSRNLLQVLCAISEQDPATLALKVMPEIRRNQQKMEWSREGERVRRVPVHRGRTFYELAVEVDLPTGRFLAVGPGHEIELRSVIGRALLTREIDGKRYESIYFLTPQVIRSGSKSG